MVWEGFNWFSVDPYPDNVDYAFVSEGLSLPGIKQRHATEIKIRDIASAHRKSSASSDGSDH